MLIEIPTPTESLMLVTRMRRTGQMDPILPKLMEEARMAQITAGELKAESIFTMTPKPSLNPLGATGLKGLSPCMYVRFCVGVLPGCDPELAVVSCPCETTRVTPNSSVCHSCPLIDIGDRVYRVSGRQKKIRMMLRAIMMVKSQ
jgi:hypothetical protein